MVFLNMLGGGNKNTAIALPGIPGGAGLWTFTVACTVLASCLTAPAPAAESAPIRAAVDAARRVLVLGDSITFDGRWVADMAAWMEYEGLEAEVIDCGLSSETVSGL